jgi:hypothetical protein
MTLDFSWARFIEIVHSEYKQFEADKPWRPWFCYPVSRCDFNENGVLNLWEPLRSLSRPDSVTRILHLGCIEVIALDILMSYSNVRNS